MSKSKVAKLKEYASRYFSVTFGVIYGHTSFEQQQPCLISSGFHRMGLVLMASPTMNSWSLSPAGTGALSMSNAASRRFLSSAALMRAGEWASGQIQSDCPSVCVSRLGWALPCRDPNRVCVMMCKINIWPDVQCFSPLKPLEDLVYNTNGASYNMHLFIQKCWEIYHSAGLSTFMELALRDTRDCSWVCSGEHWWEVSVRVY